MKRTGWVNGEYVENTKSDTRGLFRHERELVSTSYSSSYVGLPECPVEGLKEIEYKKGKRAYILKRIDAEVLDCLTSDKLYGKATVCHVVFPSTTGRMVHCDMVYKGLQWARLQSIAEKWGVTLREVDR
jgi:hypothetical protein